MLGGAENNKKGQVIDLLTKRVINQISRIKNLLRSYSSREPFSKPECANIVEATEKVEVPLDSLVNGLKDSIRIK